jgi:hypothetical protein
MILPFPAITPREEAIRVDNAVRLLWAVLRLEPLNIVELSFKLTAQIAVAALCLDAEAAAQAV